MSDFSYEPIGQWVLTKGGHAYARDTRGGPFVYLASHAHHGVFRVDHTGDLDDETIEKLIPLADYNPAEPDLSNAVWDSEVTEMIMGKAQPVVEDVVETNAALAVMKAEEKLRLKFDELYGYIETGRMGGALENFKKVTGQNDVANSMISSYQEIIDLLRLTADKIDEFQMEVTMNLRDE